MLDRCHMIYSCCRTSTAYCFMQSNSTLFPILPYHSLSSLIHLPYLTLFYPIPSLSTLFPPIPQHSTISYPIQPYPTSFFPILPYSTFDSFFRQSFSTTSDIIRQKPRFDTTTFDNIRHHLTNFDNIKQIDNIFRHHFSTRKFDNIFRQKSTFFFDNIFRHHSTKNFDNKNRQLFSTKFFDNIFFRQHSTNFDKIRQSL